MMRTATAWGLAGLMAATVAGCGGTLPAPRSVGANAPSIAVLPFEDLSGQAGVGERLSRVAYTELVRGGRWQVEEPGEVDAVLAEARVRSTAIMTRDQTVRVSERLGVRWLLAGTSLEYGRVRTPDGEVPTVGLALRLLDGRSGKVVWADQRFRSGEDRETIFSWGRINDISQLAGRTAAELLEGIRLPAVGDTSSAGRESR